MRGVPSGIGRVAQWLWWALVVGGLAATAVVALPLRPIGPEQPLPFSHRLHAGGKQISCLFCHDAADRAPRAGMPAVAKCLLCHNVIAPHFAPIQQLHGYYDSGTPIRWVRVYRLPDFVFFNHQMHVRRDIDCGHCHGDVKAMDRIAPNQKLSMGFCVDCHRRPEYQVSVDCWLCHR